ncbi:MAG: peptidase T, partial [Clostridia bacterium]
DIVLSEGYTLSSKEYPLLKRFIGKTIITSDGTTLLGADDKAGVAEIMAMAETLLSDKSISHGVVKIAFTPDEEVGRGADFFDVEGFGCDYAYTVDGAILGEMDYENFNAASATIVVNGVSIHPGSAKGKMVNAILVLQELESMLPEREKPQYTEGYEGFYHLDSMSGNVNYCKGDYIIRDHDRQKFEIKKAFMQHCCESLNHKYGAGTVDCSIKDSYYNMKDKILSNIHLVDNAKLAMEKLGVEPIIMPIRGGTDGARLSFMGLPCPNLCAGGDNFHGRYEYIPYEDMETIVKILLNIVEIYSK